MGKEGTAPTGRSARFVRFLRSGGNQSLTTVVGWARRRVRCMGGAAFCFTPPMTGVMRENCAALPGSNHKQACIDLDIAWITRDALAAAVGCTRVWVWARALPVSRKPRQDVDERYVWLSVRLFLPSRRSLCLQRCSARIPVRRCWNTFERR